jgi:integrase
MAIDPNEYPNVVKQGLKANKNFTIFFYRFMLNKKSYKGLINLSDKKAWNKRDKIQFAEAQLILIKNNKQDIEYDDNISLDSYIQKYFSYLPDTRWTTNQKQYYSNHIFSILGKKKLKEIRPLHLQDLIKTIENKKLSVRTVKVAIEILSAVFNNAIDNRIIDFNPAKSIKIKRPVTKKIVTNATDELKKINEAIHKVYEFDPFSRTLFLFALQGRRKAEILNLKWEDIDFKNNYYILRKTKNNEEQKIFLPENIKESLNEFYKLDGDYVFCSRISENQPIQNTKAIVKKMKDELKNQNFSLHYLRNVIVSAMAEQGLESIYLSGALGHNDPNTIKKYLTMNYLKSSEMASGVIDNIVKK